MQAEPSDIPSEADKLRRRAWEDRQREPKPGAWPGEDERKDRDGPNEPEKENDDGTRN